MKKNEFIAQTAQMVTVELPSTLPLDAVVLGQNLANALEEADCAPWVTHTAKYEAVQHEPGAPCKCSHNQQDHHRGQGRCFSQDCICREYSPS